MNPNPCASAQPCIRSHATDTDSSAFFNRLTGPPWLEKVESRYSSGTTGSEKERGQAASERWARNTGYLNERLLKYWHSHANASQNIRFWMKLRGRFFPSGTMVEYFLYSTYPGLGG